MYPYYGLSYLTWLECNSGNYKSSTLKAIIDVIIRGQPHFVKSHTERHNREQDHGGSYCLCVNVRVPGRCPTVGWCSVAAAPSSGGCSSSGRRTAGIPPRSDACGGARTLPKQLHSFYNIIITDTCQQHKSLCKNPNLIHIHIVSSL